MATLSEPMRRARGVFLAAAAVIVLLLPLASHAVTVGPTKLEISVDPGQTATGLLFVKNEETRKQTFYPTVQKFSQSPAGEKLFTADPEGIAKWMQLPVAVTLNPQEEKQVPFIMNVPQDAAPGGHFAVVWWSTAPPGDGGQVAIVTRAGILVYVRVSGNIVEKGSIESFGAGYRFAWGLPLSFVSTFRNEGNVALTPQGEIRVFNMFGALKAALPVNPYGGIILPGSNGSFTSVWEGKGFFFGIYKASLRLAYGEGDAAASRDFWFLMFSPLAVIILVLILILAFIAPPLVRRYNRWIIQRAQG